MRLRSINLWLVAGIIITLSMQALLYGTSPGHLVLFWLGLFVYVLIPGYVLFEYAFPDEDDFLTVLGMSWVSGLTLLTALYLASKMAGISNYFVFYPLIVLPFVIIRIRKKKAFIRIDFERSPSWPYLAGLFLIIGLAVTASLYYSPRVLLETVGEIHGDIVYHMSNIPDLRNHWPMQDSRIAGTPFQYHHYFSYAFPAAFSQIMGIPVHVIIIQILPGFSTTLMAIQLFNTGRRVAKDNLAGLLACLLALFHTDLGWAATRYLNISHSLLLNSDLGQAIYESLTTQYGSIYLITFVWLVHQWFNGRKELSIILYTALTAFVSVGMKITIMPVALCGLVLVAAGHLTIKREIPYPILRPLIIAGSSALLTSIWILSKYMLIGESNNNLELFYIAYDKFPFMTPIWHTFVTQYRLTSPLIRFGFVIVWTILYTGLTGLGGILALRRPKELGTTYWWLLASFAAGFIMMLFIPLGSNGDERSFLNHGLTLLTVVAAQGLAQLIKNFNRKQFVALGLAALLSIPTGLYAWQQIKGGLYRDSQALRTQLAPENQTISEYLEGMDWLRTETPSEAMLLVNHNGIFTSIYAERRVLYEQTIAITTLYPELYEKQRLLNISMYETPTNEQIDELMTYTGELSIDNVYLIVDNLEFYGEFGEKGVEINEITAIPDFPSARVELAYANEAIQIYRINP